MSLVGRFDNGYCDYCGYTKESNLCECYDQQEEYCCNLCDCDTIYIPPIPPPVTLKTLGTGTNLVVGGIGPNLTIKSISEGDGITFTETNNNIEISSSSPAFSVTLKAAGNTGTDLVAYGTGPNLKVKNVVATGTGLTITEDVNNNIIFQNTSPASSVTLDGTIGGAINLVENGIGPNLKIKSLLEGPGIEITDLGPNNPIEISADFSSVTLQGIGTTGKDLVAYGTGPNLKVKNVVATGTGIAITEDMNNNIIFENTSPASSVSLNSTGAGVPLVPSPNFGPTMSIKSLISGTGITMTDSGSDITISNIFTPYLGYMVWDSQITSVSTITQNGTITGHWFLQFDSVPGSFNAGAGTFTAPVDGHYQIFAAFNTNGVGKRFTLLKDTFAQLQSAAASTSSGSGALAWFNFPIQLNKNQTVSFVNVDPNDPTTISGRPNNTPNLAVSVTCFSAQRIF